MSDIVVRPYQPQDQEQTWHVRSITYNNGKPIPLEEQVYKTSTPFVGEVDGRVVGTFVIMGMTCTRGAQAEWKTAGIAGVAVLPEYRQTGVGGAMMRWALRHAREQGYILASLYAFRESYYRRFGYEVCGVRQKITCPNSRLPRHRSPLPIRRLDGDHFEAIDACYHAFARRLGGMNVRTPMHWGRVLGPTKHIYVAGDPAEAYAILEHDWQFWQDQPVVECAWSTADGHESIVSFFGSLGINKTAVTWNEPSDSPFMARHMDKGVTFEVDRPVMYRLLNPKAALETMLTGQEGEFTFSLRDPDLPENNGPWKVAFGAGRIEVAQGGNPGFELAPGAAVQAFLGQPSLERLICNGIVTGETGAAPRLLSALPVYCMDFF